MAGKPDEPRSEPAFEPGIEIVTNEPEAHSEIEVATSASARWWLLAGVLVVGAIAAASLVSGGGAPDRGDAAPTTTSVPATSVSAPQSAPPTLEPEATPGGPLLGRRHDASLLIGDTQRWRLIDLSTGITREVPALAGVSSHAITSVRGAVVVLERSFGRPSLIPFPVGVEGDVRAISESSAQPLLPEIGGERLDDVVGVLSGDPESVWVLHPPQGGVATSRLQATRVDLLGNQVAGPIDVPARPGAAATGALLVDAGGRTHLVADDGTADLGSGTTLDARHGLVARVVCDAELQCFEEVFDADVGEARPGNLISTDLVTDDRVTMVLSEQGGLATVPGLGPTVVDRPFAPTAPMLVTPPGGETVTVQLPSVRAAPAWLPDGNGLVVLSNAGLQHVSIESGLLAMRRIDGYDVGDATALFVIPH